MEIGTANYSTGNKTQIEKIKDGDNIYRIIPPLGSLAKEGKWNRYIAVEWGYKDLKGVNRPFQDVRRVNYNTKMVEVESAAHLFREKIAANYKATVEAFKKGNASSDDVKKAKELSEQYNLDKKYYLNAINTKGEIVLLKVGYKAIEGIKNEIKKLAGKGIDPLSLNDGRFFNINRSGTGLGTIYSVSIASETVEATMPDGTKASVQKELKHVIDDKIIARLAKEATDLSTLDKLYVVVTPEQVEQFVSGGPAAVSAILGERGSKSSHQGNEDEGGEVETPTNFVGFNMPVNQEPLPSNTITVSNQQPVEVTIPKTSQPAIAASLGTPAQELSKEEFLKSLGL